MRLNALEGTFGASQYAFSTLSVRSQRAWRRAFKRARLTLNRIAALPIQNMRATQSCRVFILGNLGHSARTLSAQPFSARTVMAKRQIDRTLRLAIRQRGSHTIDIEREPGRRPRRELEGTD